MGGLTTMWDGNLVVCIDHIRWRYDICCKLKWVSNNEEFIVINVYGPRCLQEKLNLLQNLSTLLVGKEDLHCLIIGNFNMIRGLEESFNL